MNEFSANDSEARIERVLGGLRSAQVPQGMESRVLRRMESRVLRRLEERAALGAAKPRWRSLSGPVSGSVNGLMLGWGLGITGVIAVALVMAGAHWSGKVVQHGPAEARREIAPTGPTVSADAVALAPSRLGVPAGGAAGSGSYVVARVAASDGSGRTVSGATELSDADVSDAVAQSEVVAPSLAASPMPLTDQERLMLDILHRGDPVQMAMLNPDERAARDAAERAEVRSFFVKPSPTVLEQPILEQTETNKGERR
jgi:hypothetical protein